MLVFKVTCLFLAGALTKGDRRAATGADLTEFNFDTPYGRNALRTMYSHICHVGYLGSYFFLRNAFRTILITFAVCGVFIRRKKNLMALGVLSLYNLHRFIYQSGSVIKVLLKQCYLCFDIRYDLITFFAYFYCFYFRKQWYQVFRCLCLHRENMILKCLTGTCRYWICLNQQRCNIKC